MKITKDTPIPNEVYNLAEDNQYDSVSRPTEGELVWNGYELFIPYNTGRRNIRGMIPFILLGKGELRWASEKENHLIIFNC